MPQNYDTNRIYNKLLWDHIETCEAQRLRKTREFIRASLALSSPDYLKSLVHTYPISDLVRDIIKGLATAVGVQITNGIPLTPFDSKKVLCGLRNYDYSNNEDVSLGLIDPVESTATGEYFFGDFIASIKSIKRHSDYTVIAYSALDYAYSEHLRRISASFYKLPPAERYTFLGVKALSRDDIDPYVRMIFYIFALLVEQPQNFDRFYEYYLDSVWDYHHEMTGSFLAESGLTTTEALAMAFRDDQIYEFCPVLIDPSMTEVVSYFYAHNYTVAKQLIDAQLGDALYLTV